MNHKRALLTSGAFAVGSMLLMAQPAQAALPARCLDIAVAHPGSPDGTYWIFPNNQAFQVYCKGMATPSPAEYLTLANTAPGANYGRYTGGGATPGGNVVTEYTRLRLDPASLLVNTGDQSFSSSTGSSSGPGGSSVTSMPYAVAMACISPFNASGSAHIDLTGTPFKVDDTFAVQGFLPSGTATFSAGGQVVAITGGGYCGWTSPAPGSYNPINNNGSFQLNLGYLQNVAPVDIKPDGVPNSINPSSAGVIPVAVLSTETFDATQVDPSQVTFGPNGTEASPAHFSLQDVNSDGRLDLMLQFPTQDTGIQCGQDFALLNLTTFSSQHYIGFDSIRTVGCK